MRELTTRIRFTQYSLGNTRTRGPWKGRDTSYLALPRGADGRIMFLPVWWQANMDFAARLLCRHQEEARKIYFDPFVEGKARALPNGLYKRYIRSNQWSVHEAFWPGDVISVNAAVPSSISTDDFWRMMDFAGRFCGLSPYHTAKSADWGFFEVLSVQPRAAELAGETANGEANTGELADSVPEGAIGNDRSEMTI